MTRIPLVLVIGFVLLVCGYLCLRLGRWYSGYAWETGGEPVAISILIRIVGFGLMVVGAVRIVTAL